MTSAKLKIIVGAIAIIAAFALDYVPMETAILVYGVIGATLGAFFRTVNKWAQDGLASIVCGAVVAILIDQVLTSELNTAAQQLNGVEAVILRAFPIILKAAIIWGAATSALKRIQETINWHS
jgi:hypothetical protein